MFGVSSVSVGVDVFGVSSVSVGVNVFGVSSVSVGVNVFGVSSVSVGVNVLMCLGCQVFLLGRCHMSVYLSICLSICLSVWHSVGRSIGQLVVLSVLMFVPMYGFVSLSVLWFLLWTCSYVGVVSVSQHFHTHECTNNKCMCLQTFNAKYICVYIYIYIQIYKHTCMNKF